MSTVSDVEIMEVSEYGAMLKCRDMETADQFEDFLTENCYVFFEIKFEITDAVFYFGQASSPEKIRELYKRFAKLVEK